MLQAPSSGVSAPPYAVGFSPPDIVNRRMATWRGAAAEAIQITRRERFEHWARAPYHLLIATERAERRDGETILEGLPRSTLRDFSRKLIFIPAGRSFHGWSDPRALSRMVHVYIDPNGALGHPELRFNEIDFQPRLFFDDSALWQTAQKLKAQMERPGSVDQLYAEALILVLKHELMRLNDGIARPLPKLRGGLANWQKNRVAQYIDDYLAEQISITTLAGLAQLSPYHFSRAFKQSFGMPPHRYHKSRRIERAKALLARHELSVTEIALEVGFDETSSFSAAFRKLTGDTPTGYRRSLD
jgi:AraC family transcriptional regulator